MSTSHSNTKQETEKRMRDPEQMSYKARRKYVRRLLFLEKITREVLEYLRKK